MPIDFKPRRLHPDELALLVNLESQAAEPTKTRLINYCIAALIGVLLTYTTSVIPDSFWTFLLGTGAIFAFGFIVFTPYENYKINKRNKIHAQQLRRMIEGDLVNTCRISADQIALATEYEDESDLYIIKLNDSEVLYVWDYEYNMNDTFPCLEFEIYDEAFSMITGQQVYALSEKTQPIKIDRKAKWNCMLRYGAPDQLAIEPIKFEDMVEKFNSCA